MLIEDTDLVVQYLKSHRGPKPSDQLTSPFEDLHVGQSKDLAIQKYSPAQQMQHKYNAEQEESTLYTKPNAYLLLLITDLMITLKGSKYFMKLDIR